ncbi:MAG: DUF3179 domain-containing protein [Rubrobacteraceae bacterium]
MNRKLTRRKFLQISCLGAAGLAAGCSTDGGTYSPESGETKSQTGQNPSLGQLKNNVASGGPGKDGIPPIDEPKFVSAREMDDQLEPDDRVFILDYEGETKVYPQPVLVWHEIVNDEVAGEKLSITYCPLTGSTVAFKGRAPNGEPLTFGTTGSLINSNLLMYDRATDSEWPQILGRAIVGRMRGKSLEEIPLVWTTWKQWKDRGTDAPVLSTDTGHFRSYGTDPYGSYSATDKGYYENPTTIFEVLAESDRLDPKEVVVGIKSGDKRHAIPKKTALQRRVWNLDLNGRPVAAVADSNLGTVRIFDRSTDGETLEFEPGGKSDLLDQKGRAWSRKGLALSGPGGATLPAANFYEVMWFGWYAFYPETGLTT